MNKTFLGIVVGISVVVTANASIISRGFLDEVLKEYEKAVELNIKLTQKADISDLERLSNTVGILSSDSISYNWLKIPYEYYMRSSLPNNGLSLPNTLTDRLNWLLNGFNDDGGPLEYIFNLLLYGEFNISNPVAGNDSMSGFDPAASDYVMGLNLLSKKVYLMEEFLDLTQKEIYIPLEGVRDGIKILVSQFIQGDAILSQAYYIQDFIVDLWFALLDLSDSVLYGYTYNKKEYSGLMGLNDKIGIVPDGYDNLGAALTAIKGVAEEVKQKVEAAIPDPKAEGANGKYVLTVDVVGDNATYRWEKIDRATGEIGTTTE